MVWAELNSNSGKIEFYLSLVCLIDDEFIGEDINKVGWVVDEGKRWTYQLNFNKLVESNWDKSFWARQIVSIINMSCPTTQIKSSFTSDSGINGSTLSWPINCKRHF